MGKWTPIPITKLFKNLDEDALTQSYSALENAFITEGDGISRLPGLKLFKDLGGSQPVYLWVHKNDMIAVTGDGKVRRLDKSGNIDSIEGPQVLGGRRITFTNDTSNLFMAAGSEIIAFDGVKNRVLSADAPKASHVGILNGHLIANEVDTDRWNYSELSKPEEWPALNVFAAVSKPSPVNAVIVTDFNEIIVSKMNSLEQYAPYTGGVQPFVWRWSIGDGVSEPYTLMFNDNAVWGLNQKHEFVRFSGQTTQVMSVDVGKDIEIKYSGPKVDSFSNAWAAPLFVNGQNFNLLQLPDAQNAYNSRGATYLHDIRKNKWSEVYGWNSSLGIPERWPGISLLYMWGKTYVGGYGKIYEFDPTSHTLDGAIQRFFVRTCHFDGLGSIRIDHLRITIKRGVGTYTYEPNLFFRVNRNSKGFGRWQKIPLGKSGEKRLIKTLGSQGNADTWQFEFMTTDDCPIEIRKIEAEVTKMPRV